MLVQDISNRWDHSRTDDDTKVVRAELLISAPNGT